MCMTTDALRLAWRPLLAVALALSATPARAHDLEPKPVRELVRIQGYRAPAPQATQAIRELTLVALGQQVRFAATEWRVFAFYDTTGVPPAADPTQLTLQGERSLLHRIASARAEQRITILAERRPGAAEVFVLSVDRCPP
jgi:hypothetical protein